MATYNDSLVAEATQDVVGDAIQDDSSERLYNAIFQAEHKGWVGDKGQPKWGYNPWIRTEHAPETGSNAYGPVQMLSSLVGNVPMTAEGNPMINYNDAELDFINRFQEQGDRFYEYGNEPDKEGYSKEFDYGGTGLNWSPEDRGTYKNVAKKIMDYEMGPVRAKGDINKFIEAWRGKPESEDQDYYDIVRTAYNE